MSFSCSEGLGFILLLSGQQQIKGTTGIPPAARLLHWLHLEHGAGGRTSHDNDIISKQPTQSRYSEPGFDPHPLTRHPASTWGAVKRFHWAGRQTSSDAHTGCLAEPSPQCAKSHLLWALRNQPGEVPGWLLRGVSARLQDRTDLTCSHVELQHRSVGLVSRCS